MYRSLGELSHSYKHKPLNTDSRALDGQWLEFAKGMLQFAFLGESVIMVYYILQNFSLLPQNCIIENIPEQLYFMSLQPASQLQFGIGIDCWFISIIARSVKETQIFCERKSV